MKPEIKIKKYDGTAGYVAVGPSVAMVEAVREAYCMPKISPFMGKVKFTDKKLSELIYVSTTDLQEVVRYALLLGHTVRIS